MVKVIASNNDAFEMYDIVETGIVAAGATRAAATQLRSRYNVVGTSGASADGVRVPDGMKEGYEIFVRNTHATAVNVYPFSATGKINGGSDGAAVAVAQNAVLRLVCAGDDLWWAF
jgi:hypothetical protein